MKSLLYLAVLLAGCVEHKDGLTGTQSIEVAIVAPTSVGSVNVRLPDSQRDVTVDLTAKDADGEVDTSFTATIRVYAQFLGTLTPRLDQTPLATIQMTNGVANDATITLPDSVLGPTTLWFDNGTGFGPDYMHGLVTGTSPTLWFRDPYITDLQRPRDEMAVDALSLTPLTDKQIAVSDSRYGDDGRLVVTSVFAQGYTVSDVQCGPGGAPPCTAAAYDHVMVFTFSAARDQSRRPLEVGDLVERFNGGLSEFNGLTEVGFPRTFVPVKLDPDTGLPVLDPQTGLEVVAPDTNPARLPAPVRVDPATWFGPLSTGNGVINFERNEAGAIEIVNAKVCPIDDDYTTYKQWKLDPAGASGSCGRDVINVITQGTDFSTDPTTLAGRVLPRVVGILRPVNIGSFNVWIMYPRGASDIQL
jgi:hypothetical protein